MAPPGALIGVTIRGYANAIHECGLQLRWAAGKTVRSKDFLDSFAWFWGILNFQNSESLSCFLLWVFFSPIDHEKHFFRWGKGHHTLEQNGKKKLAAGFHSICQCRGSLCFCWPMGFSFSAHGGDPRTPAAVANSPLQCGHPGMSEAGPKKWWTDVPQNCKLWRKKITVVCLQSQVFCIYNCMYWSYVVSLKVNSLWANPDAIRLFEEVIRVWRRLVALQKHRSLGWRPQWPYLWAHDSGMRWQQPMATSLKFPEWLSTFGLRRLLLHGSAGDPGAKSQEKIHEFWGALLFMDSI